MIGFPAARFHFGTIYSEVTLQQAFSFQNYPKVLVKKENPMAISKPTYIAFRCLDSLPIHSLEGGNSRHLMT